MKVKEKQETNVITDGKISKQCKIDLFKCLIHTVLIEAYFIITNIIKKAIMMENIAIYLKASYTIFIVLAVLLFEIAHKKKNRNLTVHGIELTLLAIHILLIEKNITITNVLSTLYIWILYYCLKAVVIYTKENRKRLKGISDISQIVKEEKPAKKVAKKRKS